MTFADILSLPEADIEDILDPEIFLNLVNSAYELSGSEALTLPKLIEAAPGIDRLVKRVEAAHRLLPPSVPEFDHFTPADQLIRNPMVLDGDGPAILKTLERAEKVILAINSKLPQR
jgi:hypothetical protein